MQILTVNHTLIPFLYQASALTERRNISEAFKMALLSFSDSGASQLISGNGEMELCQEMPDLEIKDETCVLLPLQELILACKNKPAETTVSADISESKLKLTLEGDVYRLNVLPGEQFPRIESVEPEFQVTLQQDHLKYLIDKTTFSMAQNDARHYLNGLLLEFTEKQVVAATTDGHRLAVCRLPLSSEGPKERQRYILPRRTVLFLQKMLEDSTETVKIDASSRYIHLHIGDKQLIAKLIESEFPEYEQVIPSSFSETISLKVGTVKDLLIATSIFESVKEVKFYFESGQVTATSENANGEKAEAKREIEYSGQNLTIVFNSSYLQDLLNVVETERILLDIKDPNSGVQILEQGSEAPQYVVMPIRS